MSKMKHVLTALVLVMIAGSALAQTPSGPQAGVVRWGVIGAAFVLGIAAAAGGNVTISWPASATGFVLESSPALGATATWSVVAGSPNPISGAGSVNAVTSTGARFYRLRK